MRPAAVVFDIDGTLLDSAPGIVAGFQHALRSVGFEPPDEATLRSDLGPPIGVLLTSLGLPADRLEDAIDDYRTFYAAHGQHQAGVYPGIVDLLTALDGRVRLGTATAKRTDIAESILRTHGLAGRFVAIVGTDPVRSTKAETIGHALTRLGDPDPGTVWMVGDRHSDIAGGQACGVRTVAVSWGYGSRAELTAAAPDELIDHPRQLLELLDSTR